MNQKTRGGAEVPSWKKGSKQCWTCFFQNKNMSSEFLPSKVPLVLNWRRLLSRRFCCRPFCEYGPCNQFHHGWIRVREEEARWGEVTMLYQDRFIDFFQVLAISVSLALDKTSVSVLNRAKCDHEHHGRYARHRRLFIDAVKGIVPETRLPESFLALSNMPWFRRQDPAWHGGLVPQ